VGKTLIGGAIARALVLSGKSVGVMKPFETGCSVQGSELVPEDALFLKEMAKCPEDIETICPYRLKHPLAPSVSASIEKKNIDIKEIEAVYEGMSKKYEILLVEGAGGLMVPVGENFFILDLAKTLKLPLIIVSRLCLGAINHALLTVKQAQNSGALIAGIIFNQIYPETGMAEETNPHVIKKYAGVPILGQMPFIDVERRYDADYLACLAERYIDLKIFS
jgi:dethiobiotin synthetase